VQAPHKARADRKMRKRLEPLRLVTRPFIQVLNGVGEYPDAAIVREAFGERGVAMTAGILKAFLVFISFIFLLSLRLRAL
jgi:hypothetical protein